MVKDTPKKQKRVSSSSSSSNESSDSDSRSKSNSDKSEDETTKNKKGVFNGASPSSPSTPSTPKKDWKPLNTFKKTNRNLTAIRVPIVDLDDNVDVCFLQIPKTIDPQILKKQTISFDSKTKFKANKKRFVIKPSSNPESIVIVAGNGLQMFKPISSLILERNLKESSQPSVEVVERKNVAFPDNLKVRHPLFGVDYKNKVKLDERTTEKLERAMSKINKIKTKSKKKKKDKSSIEDSLTEDGFGFLQQFNMVLESKEKRRSQIKEERSEIKEEIQQNNGNEEKEKRKKRSKSVTNDEIFIKQEEGEKKKKKKKHLVNGDSFENINVKEEKVDSETRKRKRSQSIAKEVEEVEEEIVHRKKKKRKTYE